MSPFLNLLLTQPHLRYRPGLLPVTIFEPDAPDDDRGEFDAHTACDGDLYLCTKFSYYAVRNFSYYAVRVRGSGRDMETYGAGNVVWGIFGLHHLRTGNVASANK